SILMPAHNAEKTLLHACTSILHQTWESIELIIIDDASTDSTWQQCQRIAEQDPRVKIYRSHIKAGPYTSKNIATSMATGEYITCHDADDWALPNRIEHQVTQLIDGAGKTVATVGAMLRTTE